MMIDSIHSLKKTAEELKGCTGLLIFHDEIDAGVSVVFGCNF